MLAVGRPSVKQQRTEEILDAFARCIVRYGLGGSTLERIAAEAGMQRTILRHYIGNRDELIAAFGARIEREFMEATDALFTWLPDTNRLESLVEALFDPSLRSSSQDLAIAQALISASDLYPDIGAGLRSWMLKFDRLVGKELSTQYPGAKPSAIAAVSFGLLSIYFSVDAFGPLQLPDQFSKSAKQAAWRLINTLQA